MIVFEISPLFNSFMLLFIFSDNCLSLIHPISPPSLALSEILYMLAVFINPFSLMLFIILLYCISNSSLFLI